MSPTIVNKKFTLRFAHEFDKLYETFVPRVSSWSKTIRKRWMSRLCLDVHLFLMFSYHGETLELIFHILRQTLILSEDSDDFSLKHPVQRRTLLIIINIKKIFQVTTKRTQTTLYENCEVVHLVCLPVVL